MLYFLCGVFDCFEDLVVGFVMVKVGVYFVDDFFLGWVGIVCK